MSIINSIAIFVLETYFGLFVGLIVPALRGKDYGKTKMRYPDYIETPSGLQYKVRVLGQNRLVFGKKKLLLTLGTNICSM